MTISPLSSVSAPGCQFLPYCLSATVLSKSVWQYPLRCLSDTVLTASVYSSHICFVSATVLSKSVYPLRCLWDTVLKASVYSSQLCFVSATVLTKYLWQYAHIQCNMHMQVVVQHLSDNAHLSCVWAAVVTTSVWWLPHYLCLIYSTDSISGTVPPSGIVTLVATSVWQSPPFSCVSARVLTKYMWHLQLSCVK